MSAAAPNDMFAPPVNRAMRVLDRSFFQKTVPTSAARIFNNKDISRCRTELHKAKDALDLSRIAPIRPDPSEERAANGGKCILLRPEVIHKGISNTISIVGRLEVDLRRQTGVHGARGCKPWKVMELLA